MLVSFDFDMTLIGYESLDLLIANNSDFSVEEVNKMSDRGMSGVQDFSDSLQDRLNIIFTKPVIFKETIDILVNDADQIDLDTKNWIRGNSHLVYVVSGGFEELVFPVTRLLGIDDSHVFANAFTYDSAGLIDGFDSSRPQSRNGGKPEVLSLIANRLQENITHIGDGVTDMEAANANKVKAIAFFGHIKRNKTAMIAAENNLMTALTLQEALEKACLSLA